MKTLLFILFSLCFSLNLNADSLFGSEVKWDRHSLIIGGHRVAAVMGEVHYSRIPADEWATEIKKMKEGGLTMLACYVFWNHIEELENQWDWSGQRNLREFLGVCKQEGMPVVLRMGPFCHGEVRNGGIPDWVIQRGVKTRSEDPEFLSLAERLYRQIFTQVQGLQWKDGGPVIAAQFDNEYGGRASYLLSLKRIALAIGFDLPFYTYTGWPKLATPMPFGEMVPLFGDYADGFWDRSIKEACGNYYKAFNFRSARASTAIASEQLKLDGEQVTDQHYPYFTCELGGGMMTSYHRRCFLYPEDAYAMAVVKLGSGSNLLGYYMYHGGTNPSSKIPNMYLNETQRCLATNYNDLPVLNYDFQAPLNEFGQRNPHYYMLRKLHLFMQDYGEQLAPMEANFPCEQDIPQGDDCHLRWSYRTCEGAAFVFVNNYERLRPLSAKRGIQFNVCGIKFPQKPMTIPSGTTCIFPVNIDGIRYATAQLIACREGKIYLEQIPGIATEICIDGKTLKNLKPKGTEVPVYKNIYLLDSKTAGQLFLKEVPQPKEEGCQFTKQREPQGERSITIGAKKVAEEPTDSDFETLAAIYTIDLPENIHNGLMQIDYRGDCARLYADGQLLDDNFYNGRPFQYALWRLPEMTKKLELRILPLQKNMPIYFPREADTQETGEQVKKVTVLY